MTSEQFTELKDAVERSLEEAMQHTVEFRNQLPIGTAAINNCLLLIHDAQQQLRRVECPFA